MCCAECVYLTLFNILTAGRPAYFERRSWSKSLIVNLNKQTIVWFRPNRPRLTINEDSRVKSMTKASSLPTLAT